MEKSNKHPDKNRVCCRFCHIGYGEFRYYAKGWFGSVRDAIDQAMKESK